MIIYYTKEGKFISPRHKRISDDKLHRKDGPAVIIPNYYEAWWLNGKLHRLDGPAIKRVTGYKSWHINGKPLNTKKVNDWIKENNINLKTKEHQVLFMLRFG